MRAVNLPDELVSDGCTFPGILAMMKLPLSAKKYTLYCKEHDFLRRYNIIPWYKANLLLGSRIVKDNIFGILQAPFYVIFTTISYPFYSHTKLLPNEWKEYGIYYKQIYK